MNEKRLEAWANFLAFQILEGTMLADEIKELISTTLRELDAETEKRTRHACAEAVTKVIYPGEIAYLLPEYLRSKLDKKVHEACMNAEVKE
jgi:hypothetical protein